MLHEETALDEEEISQLVSIFDALTRFDFEQRQQEAADASSSTVIAAAEDSESGASDIDASGAKTST